MKKAPLPKNEKERLRAVHDLGILDRSPEERFDRITLIATQVFNVPISTITIVNSRREWFKSCRGLSKLEGPRAISFCGHAIAQTKLPAFIVPDTKKDKRFKDNPMVTGKPYIRFYAGVNLRSPGGHNIGVLCVKDRKPRQFSKKEISLLKNLAKIAESEINDKNLRITLDERKKTDEKLARLAAIVQSSTDCIIAYKLDGTITAWNKGAEFLFGYTEKEMISKNIKIILPANKTRESFDVIKKIIKLEKIESIITERVRKDGSLVPVFLTISPIFGESGRVTTISSIAHDYTKEAEINRAKNEFISLASHQLKTPLATINWYLDEVLSGGVKLNKEEERKYIEQAQETTRKIIDLVRDLLSVSRIELGTFVINKNQVDLVNLIEKILDGARNQINSKKLVLSRKYSHKKIYTNTDVTLISMVFENLLNNSINYTPKGGKIKLEISKENSNVVIEISDTGCGIPKREQGNVFTKFFRAENAKKVISSGTGLGLYIVKSIVERLYGRIWFESKENKGTTFYVELPVRGMNKKSKT